MSTHHVMNRVVCFLYGTIGNPDDAVICMVGWANVFAESPTDDVYYAVRVNERVIVGTLTVQEIVSPLRRRNVIVHNNGSLEMRSSDVDLGVLAVSDEDTIAMVETEGNRFGQSIIDAPAPWVCRVTRGGVAFISARKIERHYRLFEFAHIFSEAIGQLLRTGKASSD